MFDAKQKTDQQHHNIDIIKIESENQLKIYYYNVSYVFIKTFMTKLFWGFLITERRESIVTALL